MHRYIYIDYIDPDICLDQPDSTKYIHVARLSSKHIKKDAAVINKYNKLYTRQIDPAHMQSGKHNMAQVL